MKITDAESRLQSHLFEVGFDETNPETAKAWIAFNDFALEVVDCEEDLLLWETGNYSFKEDKHFFCEMVRQFTQEDVMYQLHLRLCYEPSGELEGVKEAIWSEDYKSQLDWRAAVEHSVSYEILQKQMPYKAKVNFEQL